MRHLFALHALERKRDVGKHTVGPVGSAFATHIPGGDGCIAEYGGAGRPVVILAGDAHDRLDGLDAAPSFFAPVIGQRFRRRKSVLLPGMIQVRTVFRECAEPAASRGQCQLPLQKFLDLLFDNLLIQQLPARDTVHLRSQCSDPVLVFMLHPRRPCDRSADQVVAKHQICGCGKISCAEHADETDGQGRHPWADRHVPDPVAARQDQDVTLPALPEGVYRTNRHHTTPADAPQFARPEARCAVVRVARRQLHFVRVNKACVRGVFSDVG